MQKKTETKPAQTSRRPAKSPHAMHTYEDEMAAGCISPACCASVAVQALRDEVNDTPLIGLIHERSHGTVPNKHSGILVPNMLKCCTLENHVLFVSPPGIAPGAQTNFTHQKL